MFNIDSIEWDVQARDLNQMIIMSGAVDVQVLSPPNKMAYDMNAKAFINIPERACRMPMGSSAMGETSIVCIVLCLLKSRL